MTKPSPHPNTPTRIALSPAEAAAALGVSRDFFDQHILPELRIVRRGRRRLVPVRELDRWLDQHATTTLRDGQT
jgi:excisionase family DNA binding protein